MPNLYDAAIEDRFAKCVQRCLGITLYFMDTVAARGDAWVEIFPLRQHCPLLPVAARGDAWGEIYR